MKIFLVTLFFIFSQYLLAVETPLPGEYKINDSKYSYQSPSTFQFITTMPRNYWSFLKNSFSFTDDNLKGWAAIILSSAILIHYDQEVTDSTQRLGRHLGLGNNENTVGTMKVGGVTFLRRPSDLGSAMYFLGDGWVTIGFSAGFLTAGLITKDERTLTVAQQLMQGLLLTGFTTQMLKRSTGRESPIKSSRPGGAWRFFPSTSTFQGNISKYDAFPSGHLATTMSTFIILSENYQEYHWIKPVGYVAMTLLSFQMVNNSVHWAGDYPLALGIGYMLGKSIVDNGRKKLEEGENKTQVVILPVMSPDGRMGVNANVYF